MRDLFEGFKSFTNFIETEFVEERLFGYSYKLKEEDFKRLFGNLAVNLDYKDLPKCLKSQYVTGTSYFLVKHGFDKFIFSRNLNSNLLLLEFSYTDGLEYVRSISFFEKTELIIA